MTASSRRLRLQKNRNGTARIAKYIKIYIIQTPVNTPDASKPEYMKMKATVKIISDRQTAASSYFRHAFHNTGKLTLFGIRFFKELFLPPYEFGEFAVQCYKIGYKSLPLV